MKEERDFNYISEEELKPHERQQVRRLWLERLWDREERVRWQAQRAIWAWAFGVGAALFTIAASIRGMFK